MADPQPAREYCLGCENCKGEKANPQDGKTYVDCEFVKIEVDKPLADCPYRRSVSF